jgi:hypothetical protein
MSGNLSSSKVNNDQVAAIGGLSHDVRQIWGATISLGYSTSAPSQYQTYCQRKRQHPATFA